MKRIISYFTAAISALVIASACGDVDAPFETFIPQRPITAPIKAAVAVCGTETINGEIDNAERRITFQFVTEGADLTNVQVHLELIDRASPSEGFFTDSTLNLTEPYSFYVFNLETDIDFTIEAKVPQFTEVDRDNCSVFYGFPGDAPIQTDNGYGVTFSKRELFDGEYMSGYQRFTEVSYHYFGWLANTTTPWFTFDVGEPMKLFKAVVYPYWGYRQYDPAIYDIYAYIGAGEVPNPTPATWMDSPEWALIASVDISDWYEMIKVMLEDKDNRVGDPAYDPCVNGTTIVFSDYNENIPTARYYRFHVKQNFFGVYMSEMDSNWSLRSRGCTISEMLLWRYR